MLAVGKGGHEIGIVVRVVRINTRLRVGKMVCARLCEYEVMELPAPSPTHEYDLRSRDGTHDVAKLDLDSEKLEAAQLDQAVLSTRVRENVARAKAEQTKKTKKGGILKSIRKAIGRRLRGKKRVTMLDDEFV